MSDRSNSRWVPVSLRCASCSPSTASPSRLTLSRTPSPRSLPIDLPSLRSDASRIRCPTIERSTLRATGTTTPGIFGASAPPVATAARIGAAGTPESAARGRSAFWPPNADPGRTTPSTNPTVNFSPFGRSILRPDVPPTRRQATPPQPLASFVLERSRRRQGLGGRTAVIGPA